MISKTYNRYTRKYAYLLNTYSYLTIHELYNVCLPFVKWFYTVGTRYLR